VQRQDNGDDRDGADRTGSEKQPRFPRQSLPDPTSFGHTAPFGRTIDKGPHAAEVGLYNQHLVSLGGSMARERPSGRPGSGGRLPVTNAR
jgi:hypothetical protein